MTNTLSCTAPGLPERYELQRVLGEGGMGTVYSAFDRQMGRQVAIKVIHPKLADTPAARERFTREMRIAAQLEHRHIVRVYDCGQLGRLLYFTMELLNGVALSSVLRATGALPSARVLRISMHMARGLAAAHSSKVLHRDLKPSNIMLVFDGSEDGEVAKILDFGIAKILGSSEPALTLEGVILGSPAYVSPERLLGGPVDIRSDLYAFGVMMFEMLAGRLPFPQHDPETLMRAHAFEAPPQLRTLAPDVPEDLANLVHNLLEKDPARRPASADELYDKLRLIGAKRRSPYRRVALLTVAAGALSLLALLLARSPRAAAPVRVPTESARAQTPPPSAANIAPPAAGAVAPVPTPPAEPAKPKARARNTRDIWDERR